jgi:hypothetical protein
MCKNYLKKLTGPQKVALIGQIFTLTGSVLLSFSAILSLKEIPTTPLSIGNGFTEKPREQNYQTAESYFR